MEAHLGWLRSERRSENVHHSLLLSGGRQRHRATGRPGRLHHRRLAAASAATAAAVVPLLPVLLLSDRDRGRRGGGGGGSVRGLNERRRQQHQATKVQNRGRLGIRHHTLSTLTTKAHARECEPYVLVWCIQCHVVDMTLDAPKFSR